MRILRTIGVVGIACFVLLLLPPIAGANLVASDPDDTTTLDIASVSTVVSGTPTRIRFRAEFWDPILWSRDPVVQFFIDSSGGGRFDRVLMVDRRDDQRVCLLLDRLGRVRTTLAPPHTTTDGVSCSLKRGLLPTDGTAIRWQATSIYRDDVPGPAPDHAPDVGWFAHV